jgi:hypothetical protein
LKPENVIIAAAGGNDIEMMKNDGRKMIIVGSNQPLRDEVAKKLNPENISFRPKSESTSAGVLNGLKEHLDKIAVRTSKRCRAL